MKGEMQETHISPKTSQLGFKQEHTVLGSVICKCSQLVSCQLGANLH